MIFCCQHSSPSLRGVVDPTLSPNGSPALSILHSPTTLIHIHAIKNWKNRKQNLIFLKLINKNKNMAVFQLRFPPATRITGYQNNSAGSNPRPGFLQVGLKAEKKPEICTADELHFVNVSNSEWKLALWRYLPSPKVNM